MEKIVLFNTDENTYNFISRMASNMKVRCFCGAEEEGTGLGTLVEKAIKNYVPAKGEISLLLYCDISEKHMDSIIIKLRQSSYNVDFKAILTSTNKSWTLKRIFAEFDRERKELL